MVSAAVVASATTLNTGDTTPLTATLTATGPDEAGRTAMAADGCPRSRTLTDAAGRSAQDLDPGK
jgi:hypothetical protein